MPLAQLNVCIDTGLLSRTMPLAAALPPAWATEDAPAAAEDDAELAGTATAEGAGAAAEGAGGPC